MSKNRRTFLKLSAVLASGLMLPIYSCNSTDTTERGANEADTTATDQTNGKRIETFGIQLWTVKDQMQKDPRETLRQLASYGYKQIESFEGEQGMFWGMKNTEFRDYVESLGMQLVASHCNVKENFEQKVAQAAEINMQYLIDPYEGPQQSLEDYRRMAERFNQYGELCQKNGLRFAYHNHDYTFKEVEGQIPQNLLLEQTDRNLVDFELDIYWLVAAGGDPIQHLRNHQGRYRLCHIKDRMKEAAADETDASTELGRGAINYASILKVADEVGMQYYIVEQERFDNSTSMESSRMNAEFMKTLTI